MPEKTKHHVPGMGRKLRRARAIVKKWEQGYHPLDVHSPLKAAIEKKRWMRVAALILAQKLSE